MPFTDTSVKWVTDEFRGAAVINGQPGSLLAAIRQFINGWGDLTPVSVTVTGGIATAELPVLSSFEKYSVISISGNTDLNGEARTLLSIKFGSTHHNDNQYTRCLDLGHGQ